MAKKTTRPAKRTQSDTPPVQQAKIETRRLQDLQDYPDQEQFFPSPSEDDLAELADDIDRRGCKHAPEIMPEGNAAGLPGGTILCGHQRVRALRKLKKKETKVTVRYDLMQASAEEVGVEFLRDNLIRRQLDPVDRARMAVWLIKKERRAKGQSRDAANSEARDRVGKIMGVSGRHAQRFISLSEAPIEIQQAVRERRLSLADGAKVGTMSPEDQARAVADLLQDEDATAVVKRAIGKPGQSRLRTVVTVVERGLKRVPEVIQREDELSQVQRDRLLVMVRKAIKQLRRLSKTLQQVA